MVIGAVAENRERGLQASGWLEAFVGDCRSSYAPPHDAESLAEIAFKAEILFEQVGGA
jgi:hypothetical protein